MRISRGLEALGSGAVVYVLMAACSGQEAAQSSAMGAGGSGMGGAPAALGGASQGGSGPVPPAGAQTMGGATQGGAVSVGGASTGGAPAPGVVEVTVPCDREWTEGGTRRRYAQLALPGRSLYELSRIVATGAYGTSPPALYGRPEGFRSRWLYVGGPWVNDEVVGCPCLSGEPSVTFLLPPPLDQP